jgi:DNA polymerase III subunit delta'
MSVWDILQGSRAADGIRAQAASGEVAHAWLLLGPSGSGKKPAALAIAAALNCTVEPGVGCGECSTCKRIVRQRFPDVHHVLPEGPLIPVDTIREVVIPEASRSPFEGSFKVFVIEEAHRMNEAAQNALLKTLEEPQPDTVFILVSGQEDELLETIRSRCRVVRLEPVSEKRVVELLVKYGTPEDVAVLAARLSEGDYEKARAYATDSSVRQRRALWSSIPGRLGSPTDAFDSATEILDAAHAAVDEHAGAQKIELRELDEIIGSGRGTAQARNQLTKRHKRELKRLEEEVLGEALQALASFYRDVLVARAGGDSMTNIDLVVQIQAFARSTIPDDALVAAIDRCVATAASFVRNANLTLALESTMVELARLAPPPQTVAVS